MKTYFFQTALLPSLPLACSARAAGDRGTGVRAISFQQNGRGAELSLASALARRPLNHYKYSAWITTRITKWMTNFLDRLVTLNSLQCV